MVQLLISKVLEDIKQAIKSYPLLKLIERNGTIKVIGEIALVHPVRGEFDRYSVFISFPEGYPNCFPKVIETSGKIPRKDYRHVNPDDTLCLAVEPEEKAIVSGRIGFKYFLDKILIPHLARETYYEINKEYPDGEYAHGIEGFWEYFENILMTSDRRVIIKELEKILYTKWQNRNELCFCGSEAKFKNCHLKKWNEIMKSGKEYLISRLELLKKDINEK